MKEIKSTHVDADFLASLLGIESSKIGFYADVKQKIQELEAANSSLRTKKTELQAVFDAISDCVVIYDRDGLVQYRNHLTPRQFPQETLVGKGCRALFHPELETDSDYCPVGRALRGESCQVSFSLSRKTEGQLFFDVTATPITEPLGGNRALVFIRNVTDRRAREMQLLQVEKLSSIGLLAAGVAHEINNPMTSVAGYAEALQRRFRDAPELRADARLQDFPQYLEVIIREVYRCKSIIESLLSFSRKSDGIHGVVEINSLIRETLELVRHLLRDRNISLEEKLGNHLLRVQGDANALRQVFLNLLLNAVQATDDNGTVTIETLATAGRVIAKIRDTGSGIAPDLLAQIWNPFYTTKTVGQGQGLGLAVTYDIIKKHKGDIEVQSQLGYGTEFTVKLSADQDK